MAEIPEQYRARKHTSSNSSITARVPDELKAEVVELAVAERTSLSDLVIEGLARVVQDRIDSPRAPHLEVVAGILEQRLAQVRAELAAIPEA